MINSKQKKIIAGLAGTVLLGLMISLTQGFQINAEENEGEYIRTNDISIHTVFVFGDIIEESDGFEVFIQESGFDRRSNSPVFKLEGVIDASRVHLYEAADIIHQRGLEDVQHLYAHFEVDVYLQKEGINMRHFKYTDCMVSDYKVETLFDKEEGWNTSNGFTTIDSFEFECTGYMPNNPLYEMMEEAKKKPIQESDDSLPTVNKYFAIP